MITNRHRIDYLLDALAEPFPEKAKKKSCACGDAQQAATDSFQTRRDLIEGALLEALQLSGADTRKPGDHLESILDEMSEAELGKLLTCVPLKIVDTHLSDLSLFLDPERPTTLEEVIEWDKKHLQDFEKINLC